MLLEDLLYDNPRRNTTKLAEWSNIHRAIIHDILLDTICVSVDKNHLHHECPSIYIIVKQLQE